MTRDEEIEAAWKAHTAISQRRGPLTPADRDRVAEQQNWRCCYCGCRMMGTRNDDDAPTFEHLIPKVFDGSNDITNIVIACLKCNNTRGHQVV